MSVPLSQLGVRGDRAEPTGLRLELAMADTPTGAAFVALDGDGDGVGNFARVYRGRLRFAGFDLPVAVKVQRDESLVREQAESVAAKFRVEFAVHKKLADRDGTGVVRPFAFALPADAPATLPPAILCRHARHALAPLCPTCQTPLTVDPWASGTAERVLNCENCKENNRFPNVEPIRARVLKASVRQGSACEGCSKSDAECSASARWLTFFPARALAFELLEIDLEDYLNARFTGRKMDRHAAFWRHADAARAEFGPDQLGRLGEVIDLFAQLVAGVATLHRAGVTHFDLKPRNVCLTDDGGRVRLKVIDLGFAADPTGLRLLHQVQGQRRVESDYAAPEVRYPVTPNLSARPGKLPDGTLVIVLDRVPLAGRDEFDPFVLVGDTVAVGEQHRGRVLKVNRHESGAASLVVEWSGPLPAQLTAVDILKQSGPPADLFSLGMMLVGLVLGETDLRAARETLSQWMAALGGGVPEPVSPRRLTERLFRAAGQTPAVADLSAKFSKAFGEFTPVAYSLVGIALRLLFRSPVASLGCYLRHRGDDAAAGLARLTADVAAVRSEWRAVVARHRANAERQATGAAVRALVELVGRLSVGPVLPHGQPPFDPVMLHAVAHGVNPTDSAGVRAAAAELVEKYHNDTGKLVRHLRKLVEDKTDATAAGFDGRILFEMVLFADVKHFREDDLDRVRTSAGLVEKRLQRKSLTEATRAQLENWIERVTRLRNADTHWDNRYQILKAFFDWADALLAYSTERAGRRALLDFKLSQTDRPPVPIETVTLAINEWDTYRADVVGIHWAAVEGRWAGAVKGWDTNLPKIVRDTLRRTREAGEGTMKTLRQRVTDADRQVRDALGRLRRAVEIVAEGLLKPWDDELKSRWNPLRDPNRPAYLTLDRTFADNYSTEAPTDAIKAVARQRYSTATVAYFAGLLDEIRDIQTTENAGR